MNTTASSIELLESRIAPATLVGKNMITYTDGDGDHVTVTFSKPLLTSATIANNVFTFTSGNVNGSNSSAQDVAKIDLTKIGAAANDVGISVTVKAGPHGDGLAAIGNIFADDGNTIHLHLGAISVQGDLGSVEAATSVPGGTAVKSITVQTLGRYQDLISGDSLCYLSGSLGSLAVKGDVPGRLLVIGNLATAKIGGSIIGGMHGGEISVNGNLGSITLGGNVVGGSGLNTGQISVNGAIGSVTIGGSVLGGGNANAGIVYSGKGIGTVKVAHDLIAGTAAHAGMIASDGAIKSVTVGGNVIGTAGQAARITATGIATPKTQAASVALGTVTVAGRVEFGLIAAGLHTYSGSDNADASIGTVTVKGDWVASDLVAGIAIGADGHYGQTNTGAAIDDAVFSGANNAAIFARIASITIGGTILGTPAAGDGHAFAAQQFGTFKVGGSNIVLAPKIEFSPLTNSDVILEKV